MYQYCTCTVPVRILPVSIAILDQYVPNPQELREICPWRCRSMYLSRYIPAPPWDIFRFVPESSFCFIVPSSFSLSGTISTSLLFSVARSNIHALQLCTWYLYIYSSITRLLSFYYRESTGSVHFSKYNTVVRSTCKFVKRIYD